MKTLHTIYTNFAKRFAAILTILMTITINNVWAAETTTEYVFKSTASVSNNQITTDGVTWSITSETGKGSPDMDGVNFNNQSALRIGSGSNNYSSKVTLSTSAFSSYRVSKVVVSICSNNGGSKTITAKQGDITIGSTKQSFSTTTWVNNITLNSNQGNGGNLSIDISNDATAIYIHSIKVTYSESYDVDWIIEPNEGGTLLPTSGTSTTVKLNSGYTYSDNVYTILSGDAEVSQIGDVFTAIPASNTTIQINVMEIVPYTVNWYLDGNIIHTQTDNLGETLTEIPNLDDYDECDGKVFVGWITTPTYSPLQDIITNTTGMTIPYGGANYYALFAEPINNGVFIERATGTFKLYAIVNGNNYYAGTGINDRKLTSTTAIGNAGDYTITHISNDQYTIQYGNQYISHENGKVDLAYLEYNEENKSKCHWTITRTGTKGTWRVASLVDNDRALLFTTNSSANVFKAYATSNLTQDTYYDLEIGNGEAISYQNYTTTCSTDVTVTLNPNGGTGDFNGWDEVYGNYTKTVEKGNSVILPTLNDQTAYTFGGWSDGTTTHNAGTYTPETDVELTAVWIAKPLINFRTLCTYDIVLKNNYVDDDSKDGLATITSTHTAFSTFTAPSAREGYSIEGYYAESECTTKVVNSDKTLISNVTNYTDADGKWIGSETTLYTKWIGREYTVTLDDNGGSGGSGTITATYGSPMPVITLPTRTGYTFNGYWTGKTTQSTQYYDANGNSLKNWDKAGNTTTLYALWTANTNTPYVVEHYKQQLDGTYLAEADDTDNLTGTTAASVTPAVKSYEGFTAPSTQTVSIAADGSTVVTYQYTRISYNLSWDVNSGDALTGEYTSGSVKYGASITQPNTPTRIGYTFANWSPEVPATMPAGDATYTAQWQLIQYTITWSVGGSTTTSIVSVETPLSLPTSPANDALGCCADAFIGWSVYAQPTKDQVFNDVANAPEIDENKTFYAVFATTTLTEGSATATFNEMGYTNAEKVTEIALGDGEGHGDATILFAKEQSAPNYPAYYTASGALHAYAKNTITINSTSATSTITNVQFTFAAKEDGSNTISANVGTYADGTWSGSAESVVFTIGGETGHRKITSITVTTQAVEQYTNYVTKCTYGNSPTLGAATVTYNSGDGIDVRCEQTSTMNKAATLTFPNAADLTCPITLTASAGFLISTSKSNDAGYQTSLTVSPYKSGSAQAGKLRTIYVRANATGKTENYSGTITISGGEVAEQTITVNANVNCQGYTLTLKDHLGNTIGTPTSHYEGDIIELPTELEEDACSENYTFDGWSTAPVEYGSLIYNKVSFLYTMPAANVTLYPVYQCNKTADYHRVTSDLGAGNWAGDYLIAYSDQIFADGYFSGTNKGSLGDKMHIFNPNKTVENLVGDVVKADWGDNYYITLETVEGGYVLKSRDNNTENGKIYNYYTNNTNESGQISVTDSPKTAAKYAIQVVFVSQNDIRLSLSGNAAGAVFRYGSTGFRFYKDCGGNSIYLYKKSTLYTTSLICGTIEIQENDIVVTSTKDQSVKVSVPVKLTSPYNDAVAISGANVNSFSVITKENVPVNTEEVVNVELVYSPQAYDQLDTETITLTATNGATTSFQITGRSLPETFAIVAKVGNIWYALPSQGLNSETTPVGYPVKVDNNDNPTAVTSLPITAEWSLRNVYKVNGPNDRFAANGENLVFVNTENKTLYANNGNANIQTYAEYTKYAATNPERYEWVPTTTDLTNYTLKNVGRDKDLSINVNATFGTNASNIASNNLRFLPINATYNPFDMQVVEWYPTKVLVQTEAALTTVSATVGGVAVANPIVTKKGGKLYEISGLPLESNPTKILTISYDTYSCSKVIPIIISRATKSVTDAPFTTLTTSVYNYSDLVVRDGATLTINGTKQAPNKFVNVTIYPSAKIVVPENKQLSVYSLTFFGGISEIYNGSTYDINKYGVPQLSLKGTLGKTVTTMDYIMRVNLEQMYQVGVPYDVNLNEITYWDGASIALGTALYVSAYDGAARARLDWDNTWQWEVNFVDKVLKAGIGYTISAEPQVAGDTYSILRMPMKNNINSGNTETQKATINVTAHGMSDENLTDNHKGWNYLSNPYMTSISGAESGGVDNNNIVVGYLVETGKGPWEWKNDTYRYVTIPYDDGTNYYQRKFSEATLLPFKSFFLQIANSGDLSFALASRLNAPMRHLQQQENAPREVEFELLLSNDAQSDNTGLLISEEFTPAYEINADLEKMTGTMSVYTIYNGYQLAYNALSPLNAMEEIPLGYVVPTTGEYTFNLDERGDLDDIEHIYLLDHDSSITTDLMEDIYTFTATEKKNDHRFAISVILKAEEEEKTPTHLETLEWESDHPYKFIYQDKMYILRNGVIYDAMGKQVQTINK